MLLDQNLSQQASSISKKEILQQELNRLQIYSFTIQAIVSIVLVIFLITIMSQYYTFGFIGAIGIVFVLEILTFPVLSILLTLILNFIPYKNYTYKERFMRMFWISVIIFHLSIALWLSALAVKNFILLNYAT